MSLLNAILPEYDAVEYHEIVINKSQNAVFEAIKNVDFGSSKIIVTLFRLRGIPTSKLSLQGLVESGMFSQLAEDALDETVLGMMVTNKLVPVESLEQFIGNPERAKLRIGWNFKCESIDAMTTRLSTETRVALLGNISKIMFHSYWLLTKPFSGWIRKIMLQQIKEQAEK
ncbi:hypothetical protein [Halodesulfovibrio spirochaetisodalis]|uniref:Uncharacterized protein n=1 Tax=Halodesulfovibrio spirochaetisodalis TaxID=1560234 RepID=A0A1B7XL30_9BACT|nr:hypothetical protein [Halodesulfovibrio spirochaetisodalis]OBQ56227.1 hypothetical protein SP90_02615 [Halodesulfovibrio spirochaetisodalis]